MTITQVELFSEKFIINPETDCWEWTGAKFWAGYGAVRINKVTKLAHRVMYELIYGKIPEGLELDHVKELCSSKSCINPNHLEPVTHRENMLRSDNNVSTVNSRKTHCHKGHPFTMTNTRIVLTSKRLCLTCQNYRHRIYFNKIKEK